MVGLIGTAVLGIFICYLGIINMQGNISSIHFYHRSRVSEENVKPFGRLVGFGTLLCGILVIIFSIMEGITIVTKNDIYTIIAAFILFVGLTVGIIISFYAMKKYNGGIF